ncbi:MAG: hypothetical protein A3G34_12945 [Candidatus Lindowbacteria bacterium RIFCSPLOWO2_12_FULL_62_27]|nr:MAG: hypothetical protein A3I06_15110 [Candidatus Lindowbacteria bacterium RIFCSPLOWO2_02_FULL_62_12]OGH62495.1 MAG: hypothetical protein A3G34_12945 [Candidatus Lindowbacteria bacterium RIFCSPLOWO2_12_FULL_62_27]
MPRELEPGAILCKQGEVSAEIYILQEGHLEVLVKDKRGRDKKISEIKDKSSIFGEIGAILKQPRSATIRAVSHSVVQNIDVKKKALDETILGQPRLGLSISLNLAKYIKDTNAKLGRYTQFLNEIRKAIDGYLLTYYQKSKALGDLFDQTHFSWAKSIFDKAKSHICYGMGEGVSRGQEVVSGPPPAPPPPPPSEAPPTGAGAKQYNTGEILCREGEEGREIFILQSGSLDVQIGGRKVAEIKDKGAVIGEVAVLAGYASRKFEPRSATLMARESSGVVVIDGTKLEVVIAANPQLILFITKILSERLPITNGSLLAADDQIKKYLALIDTVSVTSMTLINAFEVLLHSLQSGARDKPQTEGWDREVDTTLSELKERARDLNAAYEQVSKQ